MKKKTKQPEMKEYRVSYSTKDGPDTGHWETESAELALFCQTTALKKRGSKLPLIISVEAFNRFSNKWEDKTQKLSTEIDNFNNN